jgi:hypothetical protein
MGECGGRWTGWPSSQRSNSALAIENRVTVAAVGRSKARRKERAERSAGRSPRIHSRPARRSARASSVSAAIHLARQSAGSSRPVSKLATALVARRPLLSRTKTRHQTIWRDFRGLPSQETSMLWSVSTSPAFHRSGAPASSFSRVLAAWIS